MVKKKTTQQGAGTVTANPTRYRVDGEIGRFQFCTHQLAAQGQVLFDSARELFPPLQGEQWYLTRGFQEIALHYGVARRSYRDTTQAINRQRFVEEATPVRTLRQQSERVGAQLQAQLAEKTQAILVAHGWEKTDEDAPVLGPVQTATLPAVAVAAALTACAADAAARAEMEANPVPYEDPQQSVRVAVDDVGVKRQKATRRPKKSAVPQDAESAAVKEEQKRVHTTVAHVENEDGQYVLSGLGVVAVLKQVLAFLLANGLTTRTLLVFVDGQRSLHQALIQVLSCYRHWQVILDWYHLEKRCREDLSMALPGRTRRNEVLADLLPLLWDGRVSSAQAYLKALPAEQLRNENKLAELRGYLERQRPHIPCYAVRRHLGLRNSSNRGEKENDLVVATRQKHNGMSWSPAGSIALASLSTAARNDELIRWFQTGEIQFKLAA